MQEAIAQFKQDISTLANSRIEFYFSRCNTFDNTQLKAYRDSPYSTGTTLIIGKVTKTLALVLDTAKLDVLEQCKNLLRQDYSTLAINHHDQLILLYRVDHRQMDALYWIQFKQQDRLFDLPITVLYDDQLVLGPSYYNTNDSIKQSTAINDTILQLPHVIIKELQRTNKSIWLQEEPVSRKDFGLPDLVTDARANDAKSKSPKITDTKFKVEEPKLLKPKLIFDSDYDSTHQDHHATFKFKNAVFNLDTRKIRDYKPNELATCPDDLPQTVNEIKQLVHKLRSQTSCTAYMQLDAATLDHCKSQVDTIVKAIIPNRHQRTRLLCMLARSLAGKGDQRYVHVWTGIDDVGKLILVQFIQWLFGYYCDEVDVGYFTTVKSDRKNCIDLAASGLTKMCRIALVKSSSDLVIKPTKLKDLATNPVLDDVKFNIIIASQHNVSLSPSRLKSLDIDAADVIKSQSFDVNGDMAELDYIQANISREITVGFFHILLDHYHMSKDE